MESQATGSGVSASAIQGATDHRHQRFRERAAKIIMCYLQHERYQIIHNADSTPRDQRLLDTNIARDGQYNVYSDERNNALYLEEEKCGTQPHTSITHVTPASASPDTPILSFSQFRATPRSEALC